jgi:hypothetical protein
MAGDGRRWIMALMTVLVVLLGWIIVRGGITS